MDKNQKVIEYLLGCPEIQSNPLFFNFANIKDNNKQIVTIANDKTIDNSFIDGSVRKRFAFTIMDYKSVAYNAIVKVEGADYKNENVIDMMDTQSIIDWVTEQNKNKNFPDFGTDCEIESIEAVTDNPNLNGTDTNMSPALARYGFTVEIYYIDKSGVIWGR